MNLQPKAALLDFDGVIADTEPIYDIFWNAMGKKYNLGDHFAAKIKGTIMPNIMKTYFSNLSEEEQNSILKASTDFEKDMPFPPMPGSLEFIDMLKSQGVKLALVTSSDDNKIKRLITALHFEKTFDTIVSADRITLGKPNPMCYLLAAKDLSMKPADCIVFEDSFAGIAAGNAAGMKVVALSTTNSAESLEGKAWKILPNLKGISFEEYCRW